jgi:hypothetical protein
MALFGAPDNNPVFQFLGLRLFVVNYLNITTCDKSSRAGFARAGRAIFAHGIKPSGLL